MEPIQFHINMLDSSGFGIRNSEGLRNVVGYHYHSEVQISVLVRGSGKLIVNHALQSIHEGDVFIIGSNTPHLISSSDESDQNIEFKSVYFKPDFFGLLKKDSLDLVDLYKFLELAKRGILIKAASSDILFQGIQNLKSGSFDLGKFKLLLEILEKFTIHPSKVFISAPAEPIEINELLGQRLNAVYQYSLENFRMEIGLAEIAALCNLSISRFSTLFKRHCNQSYFSFLNGIRVEDVCSKLDRKDTSIAELAFQAGFRNLSNFNRVFKKIKGMSPMEYKRRKWNNEFE